MPTRTNGTREDVGVGWFRQVSRGRTPLPHKPTQKQTRYPMKKQPYPARQRQDNKAGSSMHGTHIQATHHRHRTSEPANVPEPKMGTNDVDRRKKHGSSTEHTNLTLTTITGNTKKGDPFYHPEPNNVRQSRTVDFSIIGSHPSRSDTLSD